MKTAKNQYMNYAEYNIGNADVIEVKFDFRFPADLPGKLKPELTTINLYDSAYKSLQFVDPGTVDIPFTDLLLNEKETLYHLFFQTNFLLKDKDIDREELEKLLRLSETNYTLKGGKDGQKVYTLYDTVAISADKKELFMFKQIELKR